jgi:non-specific serine/threonine protein kinase
VFAGGFEADAVTEVCSDARLPAGRMTGLLGALVDKSVLKRQLRGSSARYWLLDTIRQYGLQRLRELGEETAIRKRHLAWIRTLGTMTGGWDGRQSEMFRRMSAERDNLWAALDFCLQPPGEVGAAAELAQDLFVYWACRGPLGDTRRVLDSLTDLSPPDSLPRARLLWVTASVASTQDDHQAAAVMSQESLRIGRLLKDAEVVGWSLTYQAVACFFAGDPAEAARLTGEAISLARSMQLSRLELGALNLLTKVSLASGELDRVLELGAQGLDISKARGELWIRSLVLNAMAQASWQQGERQRAQALVREGASCSHALDDRQGLARMAETLAWMAAEQAAHERAARLLGFAQHVREADALIMINLYRPQHDRSVGLATAGLGQSRFDVAFRHGRTMTIDEGVALAVEDKLPPRSAPAARPQPHILLTRRQLEIARLVADDLSNKQIASRLFLSERTVETHVTNILNKLGLNSRVQLGRWVADATQEG